MLRARAFVGDLQPDGRKKKQQTAADTRSFDIFHIAHDNVDTELISAALTARARAFTALTAIKAIKFGRGARGFSRQSLSRYVWF